MRLDMPVRRRSGVFMRGIEGFGAVDCSVTPNHPDCVGLAPGSTTSQFNADFYAAAAKKALTPGAQLTAPELIAASQVLNIPYSSNLYSGTPQAAYTPPPPEQAPTYISTTAAGMQTPTQIPDLASYLRDAAYSAFNITSSAAGGNLQTAIDSIAQAAATYHNIYPDAPYSSAVVTNAIQEARNYYATGGPGVYTSPVSAPSVNLVRGSGSGTQGGSGSVLTAQPFGPATPAPTGPNPFLPQKPTPTTAASTSAAPGAGADLANTGKTTTGGVDQSQTQSQSQTQGQLTFLGFDLTDPKVLMVGAALIGGVILLATSGGRK